ncbi:hypothetical protein O181_031634 [Austropuccinia psidii MF-1]|uniref:Uncharacterized protein n=1 Tax=Austropuccinia psidii MF-1 TaxID=1389203 RepID=A0A9Q3H6R6_9BASI|nr:hypothetical protein [Austropuccinia psidii MF-1]
MSLVHLRNVGIQRNQTEDRQGLFRTRKPGTGYLGHSCAWQDTKGNNTHCAINLSIQQKPQTRGLGDMDQALKLHKLLKYLFQHIMENKILNLASHWAGLGASFERICLKDIHFKSLMVVTKGWNLKRQSKLLEEGTTSIRENKHTIQVIEEQLNQTELTLVPSSSQGVDQPKSPVASHHSSTRR